MDNNMIRTQKVLSVSSSVLMPNDNNTKQEMSEASVCYFGNLSAQKMCSIFFSVHDTFSSFLK